MRRTVNAKDVDSNPTWSANLNKTVAKLARCICQPAGTWQPVLYDEVGVTYGPGHTGSNPVRLLGEHPVCTGHKWGVRSMVGHGDVASSIGVQFPGVPPNM